MADMCLYEPIHGDEANCNGVCKRGENQYCPYYFVDEVVAIMREWKKEAHVDSPILTKYDHKRQKFIIYSTKPGFLIGKAGERYFRFREKLLPKIRGHLGNEQGPPEGDDLIEFIECNDFVD